MYPCCYSIYSLEIINSTPPYTCQELNFNDIQTDLMSINFISDPVMVWGGLNQQLTQIIYAQFKWSQS